MSTHWNLHCVTCEEDAGDIEAVNHARDEFAGILRARGTILRCARLLPDTAEILFDIHARPVSPVPFLKAHEGHALAVRNEYGRVEVIPDESP